MSDATEKRALARPEDVADARAEILGHLAAGRGGDAERALARYTPAATALIIRTTFQDEVRRLADQGTPLVDAIHHAARTTEEVVTSVPGESARETVAALDNHTLGAVLGSAAGEAVSAVAELVDPKRLEDLLSEDLELWTCENPKTGERKSGLNSERLVRLLWTVLQIDDDRALGVLRRLNLDLLALPLAQALAGIDQEVVDIAEHESLEALHASVEERQERAAEVNERSGTMFDELRIGNQVLPSDLPVRDEIIQLLDRVRELSPRMYRKTLRRAQEMDIVEVRGQIEDEARERATGGELPASGEDDLFTPLDAPSDKRG